MRADRIIATCAIGLAIIYFWGIANIQVPQVEDALGPRSFPILLGVALLIAAGMLFFESRRSAAKAEPNDKSAAISQAHDFPLVAALAAVIVVYFLAFEPLGYVLSTSIFLGSLILYFYRGSRLIALCSAVGFAIVTYLVFTKLLGARLPSGILPL